MIKGIFACVRDNRLYIKEKDRKKSADEYAQFYNNKLFCSLYINFASL